MTKENALTKNENQKKLINETFEMLKYAKRSISCV